MTRKKSNNRSAKSSFIPLVFSPTEAMEISPEADFQWEPISEASEPVAPFGQKVIQKSYTTKGKSQHFRAKSPILKSMKPKSPKKVPIPTVPGPPPRAEDEDVDFDVDDIGVNLNRARPKSKGKGKASTSRPKDRGQSTPRPMPNATAPPPQIENLNLEQFLTGKGVPDMKKDVTGILNRDGDMASYLSQESTICALVQKGSLVFQTRLGAGINGEVFQLAFPNQRGRYAIKKDLKPVIPECVQKREYTWNRVGGGGTITFPKGSILCTPTTSEFVLSLIAGNFKAQGLSQNFIEVGYLASCYAGGRIKDQFTLMEQVDGDLAHLLENVKITEPNGTVRFIPKNNIPRVHIESMYVQLMHALSICQTEKIVHGDLHGGNIFYEKVANSQYSQIKKANYFSYSIANNVVIVPACPYIVKIADWGYGIKYSEPIVGSKLVAQGGFGGISNFYNKAYDVVYSTAALYSMRQDNEMLRNAMAWILRCQPNQINQYLPTCFSTDWRPLPAALLDPARLLRVTPEAILTNPDIMRGYLNFHIPVDSSVVRLDYPMDPIRVKPVPKPKSPKAKTTKPKSPSNITQSERKMLLDLQSYNKKVMIAPFGAQIDKGTCDGILQMYGQFWSTLTKGNKVIRTRKDLLKFKKETSLMFHPDKQVGEERIKWASAMMQEINQVETNCKQFL